MSSEITQLIDVGHDVTAIKYYGIAVCTILFYDYLLTLQDEIEYAWSGRKSWTFWLFIANRYFPMTYEFWLFAVTYSSNPNKKACDQSSFYSIIAFNVCTFLAQVVLTLRIYAVSKKNIPIATGFAIITISQAALGICTVVLAAEKGAQTLPPIPFDAYRLCVFIQHRTLEIVYTGISLFYDSLAFLLILFLARRSKVGGLEFTGILATIVEDATLYFLVIFTSHFVLEMTLALGRESIQLLPANGNVVFLPVMITRIMLSLRKAADSRQQNWSLLMPPTESDLPRGVKSFRPHRGQNEGEGDIPLDTFHEP